jgi:hypothetical protein
MVNKYIQGSVEEYLNRTSQSIQNSTQLNTSNTQKRIIEPFLELLGWSMRMPTESNSVELDYSVAGNSVDYALFVNGNSEVFVQTYEYDSSLPTEMAAEEILDQEFNWGVLTNGQEYEFYRMIGSELNLVRELTLSNLSNHTDFLSYLTVESIKSGRTHNESTNYDLAIQDEREVERICDNLNKDLDNSIQNLSDQTVESEVSKFKNALMRKCSTDSFFSLDSNEGIDDEKDQDAGQDNLRFGQNKNQDEQSISTESDKESNTELDEEDMVDDKNKDESSENTKGSLSRLFSIVTGIF